ncbi:MAG: hypothetical protein OMM_05046 [Candidatus Magnetoglobus multicellularis str. Araruama]|uniref:Transposase IS4-like domain-containing protein n=1 Tax=Candidatus Magnetoglobus multicellularis str. Araruama TaxID=890399 RepID=A0A1V1NYI6_9BACT|nr:MAG: hypothetical protein OMM_05046 [Candidatus Magnetoglobus multicellularis str. Araruama]
MVKFGYNRDKKKGREQIVIGLICTSSGCPIAVEVFAGNTKDETTVVDKIEELQKIYNIRDLIFVGDRGMVTQANVKKVQGNKGLHLISALTHPQINKLRQRKVIEPSLFDEKNIVEIIDPDDTTKRYCLCYNPLTAAREKILDKLY